MPDHNPLTAIELIEKLKQIPPETEIIVPDYDTEYAIKEHSEQQLAWRTAFVLGFFGGSDD